MLTVLAVLVRLTLAKRKIKKSSVLLAWFSGTPYSGTRPYHGSGCLSPVSYRGDPGSRPGQSSGICGGQSGTGGGFFSKFFGFLLSISFRRGLHISDN
jgi:hypothetical protein